MSFTHSMYPCLPPGPEPSRWFEFRLSLRAVLIVVLVFTCVLIQLGFRFDTALLCAGCIGLLAGHVTHRVLGPVRHLPRR